MKRDIIIIVKDCIMRLKPFLIFLGIFTICYIIFFVILDYIVSVIRNNREIRNVKSLINNGEYRKFANFYGVLPTAMDDDIMQIYINFNDEKDHVISKEAAYYHLSATEYAIIILYLEYLNLLYKEAIYLQKDVIKVPSFKEQELMRKYAVSLHEKRDLEFFKNTYGENAEKDLMSLDSVLLLPGVRFLNTKLYYYGDL